MNASEELRAIEAELARCEAVLSPRDGLSRYCPHTPWPRQREFLALDCLEALYGGAAGGGKTDALLLAALQNVHVPGYAALLLRRTFADLSLPNAVMDRAAQWLAPTDAHWSGLDKRWTFPSGATLSFGYCDNDRDRYRYQGAELQFIGVDELTQWPEAWYSYLFSRLRKRTGVKGNLRMRAATNPGGVGHEWVKRRFVDAVGGPPFIPAKLADNPSVDAASYLESLAKLDPVTRRQLLEGVWVRDSSGLVYRLRDDAVIDAAPACTSKLLAMDFGVSDATAFTILGWREHDPNVYVLEAFKRRGLHPSQAAEIARELEERHRFARIVGDLGGLGKAFAQEMLVRFHLPIEAAEKNNKRGYIDLMNGDMANGRIRVARHLAAELLEEWAELSWNEERTDAMRGTEDHCSDAALYGWRAARAFLAQPKAEKPPPGTPEYYAAEEKRLEEAALDEGPKRAWWHH